MAKGDDIENRLVGLAVRIVKLSDNIHYSQFKIHYFYLSALAHRRL